jgi:hypothetical protein
VVFVALVGIEVADIPHPWGVGVGQISHADQSGKFDRRKNGKVTRHILSAMQWGRRDIHTRMYHTADTYERADQYRSRSIQGRIKHCFFHFDILKKSN